MITKFADHSGKKTVGESDYSKIFVLISWNNIPENVTTNIRHVLECFVTPFVAKTDEFVKHCFQVKVFTSNFATSCMIFCLALGVTRLFYSYLLDFGCSHQALKYSQLIPILHLLSVNLDNKIRLRCSVFHDD